MKPRPRPVFFYREAVSGFNEDAPRQDAQTRHNPQISMEVDSLSPRPRPSFTGEQVSKADSQDAPRQNAESRHNPGKKEPSLPLQVSSARVEGLKEGTIDRCAFMARMENCLANTCYFDCSSKNKNAGPKSILQPAWAERAEEYSKSLNPRDVIQHMLTWHI